MKNFVGDDEFHFLIARMSTFTVIRRAGPGWKSGGIYEQPIINDHAAFLAAARDGTLRGVGDLRDS